MTSACSALPLPVIELSSQMEAVHFNCENFHDKPMEDGHIIMIYRFMKVTQSFDLQGKC